MAWWTADDRLGSSHGRRARRGPRLHGHIAVGLEAEMIDSRRGRPDHGPPRSALLGRDRSVEGLVFEEEIFIEGAELSLRMDDGNLQDPQQRRWAKVHGGHGTVVVSRVGAL